MPCDAQYGFMEGRICSTGMATVLAHAVDALHLSAAVLMCRGPLTISHIVL